MTRLPPAGSGPSVGSILATSLPAAAAIVVFGPLYGAGTRSLLGMPLTIASSLFIFSGSLQFAIVALLTAGRQRRPRHRRDHHHRGGGGSGERRLPRDRPARAGAADYAGEAAVGVVEGGITPCAAISVPWGP